ncbi:MAG: DMT family transporter [Minwuia sp.]|nr:DMT family transporter [Minwuia sp.]
MTPLAENLRGAGLMMAAMAAFVLNDTLMKLVSANLNLFQAVFLRGIGTTLLILAVARWQGVLRFRPARRDRRIMVWRTLGDMGQMICFLTALFHMPIANVSAILQSLPLAMTLAAALFLKEPVGWRRYTAIFAGFVGVLLIVRPGSEGFNVYSLVALTTVIFVVLRDLSTRQLDRAVPNIFVTLVTSLAVTAMSGVASVVQGWNSVAQGDLILLGGAAFFVSFGYMFITMAMRVGEIGFISPFRYTMLVWAILVGLFVFGDVPRPLTLLGAAIIVCSGIYTFYRERKVARGLIATTTSPRPGKIT